MSNYVCRNHPEQPVTPRGTGCPECTSTRPKRRSSDRAQRFRRQAQHRDRQTSGRGL